MMTEYEKELVKEIKFEAEAMKLDDPRLQRILIICNIILDTKPTEINPESKQPLSI